LPDTLDVKRIRDEEAERQTARRMPTAEKIGFAGGNGYRSSVMNWG
jgi:hypothetical protein